MPATFGMPGGPGVTRRAIGILLLAPLFISAGCATLTRGDRKQAIPVTSSPAGAAVFVNGVPKGVTPLQVWLTRKAKDQVIRIEYPGYNPYEIRMTRSCSAFPVIANGLLGLVVGTAVASAWYLARDETAPDWGVCIGAAVGGFLLIDVATGSGYSLMPRDLTVIMSKSDGTPRVDTLVVDAKELRNVKWIRVCRD